jgi:hypothetical protein
MIIEINQERAHLVGSYHANISRCTVHIILNDNRLFFLAVSFINTLSILYFAVTFSKFDKGFYGLNPMNIRICKL